MSETSDIVSPCIDAADALPVFALRLHSGSARGGKQQLCPTGTPDMLFVFRGGRAVFVEAKSEKGRMRDGQTEMHRKLRSLAIPVHTCRSRAEVMAILTEEINRP